MEFKNIQLMIKNFGRNHASYWGCALAGETGEACNLIKKYERDGLLNKYDLSLELADIFIYLVLTARYFDIDLENAILEKIKIIDERLSNQDWCTICGDLRNQVNRK